MFNMQSETPEKVQGEPLKFYISSSDIVRYMVEFPSGKTHIFLPYEEYVTTDDEEIDFLSKQPYLCCGRLSDSQFRIWAVKKFRDMPDCRNMQWTADRNKDVLMGSLEGYEAIEFIEEHPEYDSLDNALSTGTLEEAIEKDVSKREIIKPKPKSARRSK